MSVVTTVRQFKEGNFNMITISAEELRAVIDAIGEALPYLEIGEHEGDVDDEVVDALELQYERLCKLVEGL